MTHNLSASITLRPLTAADLPHVTRIHRAAFRDSALTALGDEAVRRYYAWQLSGPHDVTAFGAWHEDSMAGFYFGGIFRGALSGFLAQERAYLAWRVATHPWLLLNPLFRDRLDTGLRVLRKKLWRRSAPPVNTAPQPKHPSRFGILAIAVHPNFQGAGVGRQMMDSAESAARAGNFQEMQLHVLPTNNEAIRFYERLGWQRVFINDNWQGEMLKPLS